MNGMGGSFTGIGGSHAPEYALWASGTMFLFKEGSARAVLLLILYLVFIGIARHFTCFTVLKISFLTLF